VSKLIKFLEQAGTVRGLQIFQILRFLTFFITGVLLSKTFLTVRQIGIYESFVFLSGAFSFFWVSGILNSLLSRYDEHNPIKAASEIFNTGLLLITVNFALVVLLFVFNKIIYSLIPENPEDIFPFLIAYILLNNPTYLIEYILLLKKKPLRLISYGTTAFVLHLAAVFIPLLIGKDIEYMFYGILGLAIVKNIYLFLLLKKNGYFRINTSEWANQLSLAIPLTLSLLISGSAEYIDGLLISTHFGNDAFVVFRYGAKELPLATLMANSLSMAMVPILRNGATISMQGLEKLKTETTGLMHLLFPLTILLLFFSPLIYPVLFRPEFSQSAGIFNIYLLLLISRMLFPQSIIMASQKTGIIFKTALIEISVNIVGSYLLMLKFGIMGVAIGTVIAFFSEKLILTIWCHYRLKISIRKYLPVKTWLIYTLILLAVYFSTLHFGDLLY
jgi:O-antigen/teichoic acid export membrane protein